eukprot:2035671-Amphidinium_carterae.1
MYSDCESLPCHMRLLSAFTFEDTWGTQSVQISHAKPTTLGPLRSTLFPPSYSKTLLSYREARKSTEGKGISLEERKLLCAPTRSKFCTFLELVDRAKALLFRIRSFGELVEVGEEGSK